MIKSYLTGWGWLYGLTDIIIPYHIYSLKIHIIDIYL